MNNAGEEHRFGPVRLLLHTGDLAGLATITLADPARRNTMGPPMFDGLEAAILQLEAATAAPVRFLLASTRRPSHLWTS
jgi:enoyl-CoA hydratase/carnithine racemase